MCKILNDVKEIVESYNLEKIKIPEKYKNLYKYLEQHPEDMTSYVSEKSDAYFLKKYKNNIELGHYGFSLGTPIIPKWCDIIDNILQLCLKYDKSFQIFQIKIKYGAVCFYTHSVIISDLLDVEIYLLNKLSDRSLIF